MAKIMVISNDGTATFYEDYALPTDLYFEDYLYGLERALVEALEYEDELKEEAQADTWIYDMDPPEDDEEE